MISPQTPIKAVIAAHAETRVVFARHGLDTCCGGAHPVEMAARAHKLDLTTLMADLEAAAAPRQVGPEASVRDVIARWPSATCRPPWPLVPRATRFPFA